MILQGTTQRPLDHLTSGVNIPLAVASLICLLSQLSVLEPNINARLASRLIFLFAWISSVLILSPVRTTYPLPCGFIYTQAYSTRLCFERLLFVLV